MTLEAAMVDFVRRTEACFPSDTPTVSPAETRRLYDAMCRTFARPRPAGLTVEDLAVGSPARPVPVRLYRPAGGGAGGLILYLHGGGWVVGGLDSHDTTTATLAAETGHTVVAVDYRLAPEHPYPAAVEDTRAVYAAIAANPARFGTAPGRIAVAGDSAGGNLAASLCLWTRDSGQPPPCGQALLYPTLGPGLALDLPSYQTEANAPMLTADDMIYYWSLYMGGRKPEPAAAPLTSDRFDNLPPAFIAVAEHDPLCDDGALYASRLSDAGVAADLHFGTGLVHGFLRALPDSPGVRRVFDGLIKALAGMLAIAR